MIMKYFIITPSFSYFFPGSQALSLRILIKNPNHLVNEKLLIFSHARTFLLKI